MQASFNTGLVIVTFLLPIFISNIYHGKCFPPFSIFSMAGCAVFYVQSMPFDSDAIALSLVSVSIICNSHGSSFEF
jgi:hypothetical protein